MLLFFMVMAVVMLMAPPSPTMRVTHASRWLVPNINMVNRSISHAFLLKERGWRRGALFGGGCVGHDGGSVLVLVVVWMDGLLYEDRLQIVDM